MNNIKYEKMYDMLLEYEKMIHERNQRRIKIGLKCIWIIPLIFLFLLFWTDSSKIIFLILWIASLFAIAMYLIAVEYMDYQLQEKLHELDEDAEISNLMVRDIDNVENAIKAAISRLDISLNAQEELKLSKSESVEEKQDESVEIPEDNHLIEDRALEMQKISEEIVEVKENVIPLNQEKEENEISFEQGTKKVEETDDEKHI